MSNLSEVAVPDIGDFKDVQLIQLMVAVGDLVKVGDPLVVLETEKATIDVPAPCAGLVHSIAANVGARVSFGSPLMTLENETASSERVRERAAPSEDLHLASSAFGTAPELPAPRELNAPRSTPIAAPVCLHSWPTQDVKPGVRAGPGVRALARRLGVDLSNVGGTGPRARVVREDVHALVKATMIELGSLASAPSAAPPVMAAAPLDYSKFGPTDRVSMSRIQKVSGARLARNWSCIPHVTNFDEADITDLESFRLSLNAEHRSEGPKFTVLPFLIKAAASALRKHARLNSSVDGDSLVLKKYVNIGFAADTPDGLLVPVIRDVDKKGIIDIALIATTLAAKAREGSLKSVDMEGGCFTVSSLGGIAGSGFTPIINAPEVAILGAAKARMEPRWDGQQFVPRFILPLTLSWDHRAIDGAIAARFLADLVHYLQDLRRAML
jgi:pyruvate dehydrogenase E2 component (dihydrolipoamide acetyltransferase)